MKWKWEVHTADSVGVTWVVMTLQRDGWQILAIHFVEVDERSMWYIVARRRE